MHSTIKTATNLLALLIVAIALASCAAPTYLPSPTMYYPTIENTCTFGVQNMDGNANVEGNALACHYDGFDVVYNISENLVTSFVIINNTNKSLIIDKSKCYVLYEGYSTQLFKDVRSSRSTTFNNVQDAINNVQTNEAGASMTIPPYSKWELPILETNVREIKQLPEFITSAGIHAITPYDKQETVEFVIPYSYDYSMAEWKTCRNRIYVKSIEVKNTTSTSPLSINRLITLSGNQYKRIQPGNNSLIDYTEANRVDDINWARYKKHRKQVRISHGIWGVVLFPTIWGAAACWIRGCDHKPPQYGNIPRK